MRGGGPPDRRRGGSPPPPQRRGDDMRGGDRRGGPGGYPGPPPPPAAYRGRRGRSPSPPMGGFRRSPPPKRFRRDDDYDRFGPPPPHGYRDGPPPPPYFDRRGPPMGPPPPGYRGDHPRDRFDDRYRDPYGPPPYGPPSAYRRDYPPSPPPPRRQGPMTYKELMQELPDDITPEDAQKEYQVYLAEWWGSEVRAQFEAAKNDDSVRRRFDPREHQKAVDARNALAVSTTESFLKDYTLGDMNPAAPDFNQGNGPVVEEETAARGAADEPAAASPSAQAGTDSKPQPFGPPLRCKGGSPASQPGSARKQSGSTRTPPSPAKVKVAPEVTWQPQRVASDLKLARELAAKLDAEKGIPENPLLASGDVTQRANGAGPAVLEDGSPVSGGEEPAAAAGKEEGEEDSAEEQVGKLDVLLTYLWRVHGADFYAGAEVAEPEEEQRSGPRPTLRCPRPEEGEQPAEGAEKEQEAILQKGVDEVWRARLNRGDPFEDPLQKEAVEKHLEEWIEAQIVQIGEKKWGSKVSQKLFVDKAFVVKHIRNKHAHLLDAEREQYQDELFFENFKAARDEEERAAKEAAEAARRAEFGGGVDGQWGGEGGAPDGVVPELPAPYMAGGGGPMAGGGLAAAGGMGSVPAGMVLVPAPGAGPFGPFIPVPMDQAGRGGMMTPGMGGRGGRGPMGGRGGGMMGGRGLGAGRRGPGMQMGMPMARMGVREYTDLDAPENQRSVLDYGDL